MMVLEALLLPVIAWWALIQLFGLAALPLVRRVFCGLPDGGYAFSKTAGLLLVSYLLWLGASAGLLTNSTGGILTALLLLAAFSAWTLFARGGRNPGARMRSFWQQNKGHILAAESLFLLTFAGWALVRAYAPDKILFMSGEKFMEIGFLNGVLNSPRFPPLDPWMAGYGISYYYFGYVMMGVMTRISGVAATVGFDLYDALLFALTAVTAYGVVSNLVARSGGTRQAASGFGLLGALFVGGLGNLEGLLEGLFSSRALPGAFWSWIDIPDLAGSLQNGSFYPGGGWWWWRASRVLHDLDLFSKPTLYQPIDEFPFFSFLLGDNHPHKLALPFVLLAMGLAANLFFRVQQVQPGLIDNTLPARRRWSGWAWLGGGEIETVLFYAAVLGGLAFLNTWDFPIYLGLVLMAYAAGRYLSARSDDPAQPSQPGQMRIALETAALGFGLGLASILLYGFFYLSFSSQAGGVLPYVFQPTRLAQYLVMFGPFVFILVFFIYTAARHSAERGSLLRRFARAWLAITGLCFSVFLLLLAAGLLVFNGSSAEIQSTILWMLGGLAPAEAFGRILQARVFQPWLYLVLSTLMALALTAILSRARAEPAQPGLRFALLLAFTGLALTLVVEFVYLRDNFGMRMNTVFKFYFQAWVMMACASAYGVWWVCRFAARPARVIFQVGVTLLTAAGLVYTVMGIASRTDGFRFTPSLDSAATFAGKYPGSGTAYWAAHPDDWAAVQWLSQNGRLPDGSAPVILEAGSRGYENAGRISAFTGFPTLLGWTNHEGQWRGNSMEIDRREPVIETIYTTPSPDKALALLKAWHVRYVILGDAERQYIEKYCQNPDHPCSISQALDKFDQVLKPVFTQGSITVYQTPD